MENQKWYSYRELINSKQGIKWKIYLNQYLKKQSNWKGSKPSDFEYLIQLVNGQSEIVELRNVTLLKDMFPI